MTHVKAHPSRTPFLRAGFSLSVIGGVAISIWVGVSAPLPLLPKAMALAVLPLLLIGAFRCAVSEVICNRNRLVVVTPCGRKTYHRREVTSISCERIPSSFFFLFTISRKDATKRRHFLIAPATNLGSYTVSADAMDKAYGEFRHEVSRG